MNLLTEYDFLYYYLHKLKWSKALIALFWLKISKKKYLNRFYSYYCLNLLLYYLRPNVDDITVGRLYWAEPLNRNGVSIWKIFLKNMSFSSFQAWNPSTLRNSWLYWLPNSRFLTFFIDFNYNGIFLKRLLEINITLYFFNKMKILDFTNCTLLFF